MNTTAPPVAVEKPSAATQRLLFVDNIRVFLTILVLVHHLMITYAGTGSWYYTEGREDFLTGALGVWFEATNQAYFMGLFLLISAYFVPGSYDRKGPLCFLKDRLIRLGIPLALYSWVLRPVLVYLDPMTRYSRLSFWAFYRLLYFRRNPILGSGPLWFIETLLIFSFVYVLWRTIVSWLRPRPPETSPRPVLEARFPANASIGLFAVLVGLAGFAVRQWHPMLWTYKPLNLQIPFFAQYIALFVVGLVAFRRNWFRGLPDSTGRLWLGIAGVMVVLFWPLMIGGGALTFGLTPFLGGMHWQALGYALWESFVCISMSIGLVYAFRRQADRQGKLAALLSRNAYTAYLIHGPLIVALAYAVRGVVLYPLLKWAVVALVAVPLCFALSALIRKLPYADRVL